MEKIWTEANVIINGEELTFAQSMTLRVAISSFIMWLYNDESEELGPIREGYKARTGEIQNAIFKRQQAEKTG